MYTGQIATISNRATWTSDVIQLVDEDDDDAVIDITNEDIGFDAVVTIADDRQCVLVSGSIDGGEVTLTGTGDDIGFQWQFSSDDLTVLCAGTYLLGVKITVNDETNDIIIGSIAVVEGNR